jgi:hypothetical protein
VYEFERTENIERNLIILKELLESNQKCTIYTKDGGDMIVKIVSVDQWIIIVELERGARILLVIAEINKVEVMSHVEDTGE